MFTLPESGRLRLKFFSMILATLVVVGLSQASTAIASAAGPTTLIYCDVSANAYYSSPILWANETGVARGLDENYFAPDQPITRGQFVTLLFRYATWVDGEAPTVNRPNPFADVTPGSYYEVPIRWAAENNITLGLNPTTFQPDAPTTRAQTAAFLHRYNGSPTTAYNPTFTDIAPTDWYAQPISWLVNQAITTGTTPNQFSPNQLTTRAQVVTFLWRMAGSPTPTQLPVARNCHSTFTAIGDSVMLGAKLSGDFTPTSFSNWTGTVDAAVCRLADVAHNSCHKELLPSTLDVIRSQAADGSIGEVLIIHTGTPGPFDASTFDLLVEAAADAEVIWFVNTQDRATWRDPTNAVIADGVARWAPRRAIRLLDWFALSEANPDLLDPRDGTHLSEAGYKAYSALLATALQP